MARRGSRPTTPERAVLPWRVVAGAFLHFALPAYLIVGLALCVVGLLAGLAAAGLAARAVRFSAWFVAVYPVLAIAGTVAAAALDPLLRRRRRRRAAGDPRTAGRQSRARLASALAAGRSRFDPPAVAVLDALAAAAWAHDDPGFQAVSADLAQVVGTAIAALDTSTPERAQDLAKMTTAALARIAERIGDLQDERRRLDEGDLRTVARYIDSRYPSSDCAGDSVR